MIDVVQAEIAKLPPPDDNPTWYQRFGQAVEDAIMALCDRENGRASLGGSTETMTLGGIRASCTCGAHGLMRNWVDGAWRSIQKQSEAAS